MSDQIDLTQERDVSDEVSDYEAETNTEPTAEEEPKPEDIIRFISMDTYSYSITKNAINWEETADNVQDLNSNLFLIRKLMNELIFNRHSTNSADTITRVMGLVLPFIQGFGFDPTTNYKAIYPDCDDFDIALMYCIDAMEIMKKILEEIRVYQTSKNLIGDIFGSVQTLQSQSEEETSDEN